MRAFLFGFCMSGNHDWCRGAIARPGNGSEPCRCACACHQGRPVAEPEAVNPRVLREVVPGKRDTKLLDAWGETLKKTGRLELDVPSDKRQLASVRERLYTAGRRQSLKVSVRVADGKVLATAR